MWVWSLDQKDLLQKEMATLSSVLAWESPRTEKPGGLRSMKSQKSQTRPSNSTRRRKLSGVPQGSVVKNPPANAGDMFDPWVGKIPCRRTLRPTPVFLSYGQRSLEGYSSRDCKRVGHDSVTQQQQQGFLLNRGGNWGWKRFHNLETDGYRWLRCNMDSISRTPTIFLSFVDYDLLGSWLLPICCLKWWHRIWSLNLTVITWVCRGQSHLSKFSLMLCYCIFIYYLILWYCM